MEWWNSLLAILVAFGALLFASAVYALHWAAKNGQFDDFEKGAKTIFTEEEPEGEPLDSFPGKNKRSSKRMKHSARTKDRENV